jgi:hypothetical protein
MYTKLYKEGYYMNKRFDIKKLTLTDFKPSAFQEATGKLSLEQQQQTGQSNTPVNDPVPEGRTTLHLNKVHGVISSPSGTTAPVNAMAPSTGIVSPSAPVSSASSVTVAPTNTVESVGSVTPTVATNQSVQAEVLPAPVASIQPSPEEQVSVLPKEQTSLVQLPSSISEPIEEKVLNQQPGESILGTTQSPEIRDERTAALHVKAIRPQYIKQQEAEPEDLVAFNTRQPKWLKDKFFMACGEKGATPSIIIRNLMKSYCGLCLILFVFSTSIFASQDTTYSTEQILSYFYSKTFSGIKAIIPDMKASIGARHSLWQTGALDSTDYIYADRSNTRLEARVEIPILDISYLKDRSKDKNELRAIVMKSLSKILAAQKTVNILETRSSALKLRLEYQRNQVALKLINKSDMFSLEDAFYTVQSQLYESQSTLEQRIIDLAVIAGNDWLEVYKMIVKWDTKLF